MKQLLDIATAHGVKCSIWDKKGVRLYINDCRQTSIYNTRKTTQKAYIDLETFEVKCFTECPAQGYQWCKNESDRVIAALQPMARLLRMISKKIC